LGDLKMCFNILTGREVLGPTGGHQEEALDVAVLPESGGDKLR